MLLILRSSLISAVLLVGLYSGNWAKQINQHSFLFNTHQRLFTFLLAPKHLDLSLDAVSCIHCCNTNMRWRWMRWSLKCILFAEHIDGNRMKGLSSACIYWNMTFWNKICDSSEYIMPPSCQIKLWWHNWVKIMKRL